MSKTLVLSMLFAIAGALIFTGSARANDAEVAVNAPETIRQGTSFVASIDVSPAETVGGLVVEVSFAEEELEALGCSASTGPCDAEAGPGLVTFALMSFVGLGEGAGTVDFMVQEPGDVGIGLTVKDCTDTEGNKIPCDGIGVTVTSLQLGATQEWVWGDIDCDGEVRIGDAVKISRHLLGMPVEQADGCPALGEHVMADGKEGLWGDVDCDGKVLIGDAVKTSRHLLGVPVSQNGECPAIADSVPIATWGG
jgi:hypothetical protein